MVCFNNNFLLLLLSVFFFFCLARSNENLINNLCSKTEEPVICKDCLHSDPKSTSADAKGLAQIALGCAELDTTQFCNGTFELVQNTTGRLKGIMDDCATTTSIAQREFAPVKGYVEQGDYKSARDVILGIIVPFLTSCLQSFDRVPDLPVPQVVLAGSLASNQTSKIAASILANI